MNHPYIASTNGQERYQRMLTDAESHRQMKACHTPRTSISILTKLRQVLDDLTPLNAGRSADTPA